MRSTGVRTFLLLSTVAALALGPGGALSPRAQIPDPPASPTAAAQGGAGPSDPAAPQPAEEEKKASFTWDFSWERWDGLHYTVLKTTTLTTQVESRGGRSLFDLTQVAFKGKFGGKFAFDGAAFGGEKNVDEAQNGWETRRLRVYMSGDIVFLTPWSFRIELGKTGQNFTTEESYIQFKSFPRVGLLQLGYFTPNMSLENVLAARDWMFMELSSPVMALAPGANVGAQLSRPAFKERMTWSLGLMTTPATTDTGDASKDARRAIGRVTWLAKEGEGDRGPTLLHLGASGSYLLSNSDSLRYRSRPESHLAPYMVGTGDIKAHSASTLGLEGAWVDGPVMVQGEVIRTSVNGRSSDGAAFWGAYVSAGWFLTGESRPYSKPDGFFTRVRPSRNFSWKEGGRGALEVVGRYSILDLNSGAVLGGEMRCLTAGLNWYLNPNAKLRLNIVRARGDSQGLPSRLDIAEVRLEFDF